MLCAQRGDVPYQEDVPALSSGMEKTSCGACDPWQGRRRRLRAQVHRSLGGTMVIGLIVFKGRQLSGNADSTPRIDTSPQSSMWLVRYPTTRYYHTNMRVACWDSSSGGKPDG